MNYQEFWRTEPDGIVHADPEGFIEGYYIYPPKYEDESSDKYELWLIKEDGNCNHDKVYKFNTLEEAKENAINKFKSIIQSYIGIFSM